LAKRSVWNNAGLWVVLVIAATEALLCRFLPGRYFNHEVDHILYDVEHVAYNATVLVIGDSVGNGIFDSWRNDSGRNEVDPLAVLTCNQAIEMPGQYYLVRRYLRKHPRPGAVLFCGIDPRSGNLEQALTENYFQRCFTRWVEIGECFGATGNPVFAGKMLLYKLLPSFKYRVHLQRRLIGIGDPEILANPGARASDARKSYGLFSLAAHAMQKARGDRLSPVYLRRTIASLEHEGIPFYYLPPPALRASNKYRLGVLSKQQALAQEFRNYTVLSDLYVTYPDDHFCDGYHLSAKGIEAYHTLLREPLAAIVADARARQDDRDR